jgi:hypothetical protein
MIGHLLWIGERSGFSDVVDMTHGTSSLSAIRWNIKQQIAIEGLKADAERLSYRNLRVILFETCFKG